MTLIRLQSHARRRLRPSGWSSAVFAAMMLAAVVVPAPHAAGSTPENLPAGIALVGPTGVGTEADPITYELGVSCKDLVDAGGAVTIQLGQAEEGKSYRFVTEFAEPLANRNCYVARSSTGLSGALNFTYQDDGTLSGGDLMFDLNRPVVFDVVLPFTQSSVSVFILFNTLPDTQQALVANFVLNGPSNSTNSGDGNDGNGGGGQDGSDTTGAEIESAVATAVAQSTAAGIAGTSAGLLVRGSEVVPVSSTIASGVGPRGGVVLAADGLTVSVASAVGARPGSGVVVPEGGSIECSLCGGFVPGSVVEAWVNSDPRLTAAVRIPADAKDGDCHSLVVPTGAPLDGGGPIEAGAHTLQLRMETQDGFAVLSTGITIGSVTPTGVPAGEGSLLLTGVVGGLLALLAAVALGRRSAASRRQVVSG